MPSTASSPLSLHDALPIFLKLVGGCFLFCTREAYQSIGGFCERYYAAEEAAFIKQLKRIGPFVVPVPTVITSGRKLRAHSARRDRKSTRLNSSHLGISYAVHRVLPPFPTRRSSDLPEARRRLLPLLHPRGVPVDRRLLRALLCGRGGGVHQAAQADRAVRRPGADRDHLRPQVAGAFGSTRSEEHTSELQSLRHLVCRPPRPPPFPYTTLFRSS